MKSNSKNTVEDITNRSIDKSISQSPDRKNQIRTPSPDKSKKSSEYIDSFEPFENDIEPKELEVKKLSYSSSSSSSSSLSNLSQNNRDKLDDRNSNINKEKLDTEQSNIQEKNDSISYEEDFENSAKSSSSDNDDF